jgi:hypothetical protein
LGKNVDQAAITSVLNSVAGAGKEYYDKNFKDASKSVTDAFKTIKDAGQSLDDNIKIQNNIISGMNDCVAYSQTQSSRYYENLEKYNYNKSLYEQTGDNNFLVEANAYADNVNRASYEVGWSHGLYNDVKKQLEEAQGEVAQLEANFNAAKENLNSSIEYFQQTENENAEKIVNTFNETAAIKERIETMARDYNLPGLLNL